MMFFLRLSTLVSGVGKNFSDFVDCKLAGPDFGENNSPPKVSSIYFVILTFDSLRFNASKAALNCSCSRRLKSGSFKIHFDRTLPERVDL